MKIKTSALRLKGNIFPPPFNPYIEYQVPIIKIIIDAILKKLNGLVIQPTATGKSTEAAFVARSCILLHNMRGIYLYDENDGLHQARKNFEYIFGQNQIKCGNFFGGSDRTNIMEADLVFASFQSMNNFHREWYKMFTKDHFDFMLVNEAHHGQAVTYRPVIEYFECPHIGFTGTPERMDGLDILEIFDRVLVNMTLEEAIAKGRVSPVEYHILGNNLSSKHLRQLTVGFVEKGKKISLKQVNESIFIDELDTEMLKEVYKFAFPEDEASRQVKIFCENIVHANRIVSQIKSDGHNAEVAHSKMGDRHNSNSLERFRQSTIQFLISVDKYNEDIDIPSIEVVVFFRTTDSLTVFLQQLGRGLRKGKPKLYVLDFVGNAERMLLLRELQERIKSYTKGMPIDKHRLDFTSLGFELKWHGYTPDTLKLIQAIQLGKYKTWQEASKSTIGLKIGSSTEYLKLKAYRKDPRLPPNPYYAYSDFPGWLIFLSKEIAPKGWQSASQIVSSSKLFVGYDDIKKFANQYRSINFNWFKNYYDQVGKLVEYYHPDLVDEILKGLADKKFATKDWFLLGEVASFFNKNPPVISRIISNLTLKEEFPELIKSFMGAKHKSFIHYHADLFEKIKNELNKQIPPPEGWESATALRNKEDLTVSFEGIKNFTDPFKKSNPDWFKEFYSQATGYTEFYHPDLVKTVHQKFGPIERPKAPKGWMSKRQISKTGIRAKPETISLFVGPFRKSNSDWFKEFWNESGDFHEYYHPDLVFLVQNHFNEREIAPLDWATPGYLIKNEALSIKPKTIKVFAETFRRDNSKWFQKFLTTKGNKFVEHYHPALVKKIKEKFAHLKEKKKP